MADLVIRGMEMPTNRDITIRIDPSGEVYVYGTYPTLLLRAVTLPEGYGQYISREAAMAMPWANGQYDHEHANEHFILGLESYKEWLEYVPAADVVEVVRCKDCFAYQRVPELAEVDGLDPREYCALLRCEFGPDGFCSYGRRADNG